jgi:ubiquinone/menaquinone biosynthesis C-methylase UbiE
MRETIQSEFTRQAKAMAGASAFHAEAALEHLVKAVRTSAPQRVLDLACGPGIVAEAVSPLVREVAGIDATPEMIRLAQERFERAHLTNGSFRVAWAEALPFDGAEFDGVIARLLFHHLPDLAAVLREVRRVLRPSGHLYVADVLSSDEPEESRLHNQWEQERDPTHVRMLTRSELLDTVRLAGFEVISEKTWKQERCFGEWAQIVADPARTEPLLRAMRASAAQGRRAGIDLLDESGELKFTQTWLMVVAQA